MSFGLPATPMAPAGAILRPGGFALTERAVRCCAFEPGARVADIGCGSGATAAYLNRCHGLKAVGFDLAAAGGPGLSPDDARPPVGAGKAEELPLADGVLDGVLAECSLSVIADKERAVGEFRRVLHPGGKMVVTDVYARNPEGLATLSGLPLPFGMADLLTRETLTSLLHRHGFSLLLWEDHSEALKRFVIEAIMGDHAAGCGGVACFADLKPARPGYFLLVAAAW